MVRQLVETFFCDICGSEGERYTMQYPDGTLVMDRCGRHDAKILKMKEEKGTWKTPESGRTGFKISTPDEIAQQRDRHRT